MCVKVNALIDLAKWTERNDGCFNSASYADASTHAAPNSIESNCAPFWRDSMNFRTVNLK